MSAPSRGMGREAIGVSHLGIGMTVVADIVVLAGFIAFLVNWGEYPRPWLCVAAWAILIATVAAGELALIIRGDRVPDWGVGAYLTALAVCVVLDIWGAWNRGSVGNYPTAALTAGAALLVVAPVSRIRVILISTAVLAFALAATFGSEARVHVVAFAPNIIAMMIAIACPLLGGVVVHSFRNVIQLELDRVQAHSAVSGPRFAVGLFASEELTRLDFAAEQYFDDVASGRTALPLDAQTAANAGALATELRRRLVAGRRETWLYHAISESAFLGPSVTLADPEGLAGLLERDQRDGLLTALWFLLGDPARQGQHVRVDIGSGNLEAARSSTQLSIPIAISSTAVPRARVDPAASDALRRVGTTVESTHAASFRANIDCRVDNPVDL